MIMMLPKFSILCRRWGYSKWFRYNKRKRRLLLKNRKRKRQKLLHILRMASLHPFFLIFHIEIPLVLKGWGLRRIILLFVVLKLVTYLSWLIWTFSDGRRNKPVWALELVQFAWAYRFIHGIITELVCCILRKYKLMSKLFIYFCDFWAVWFCEFHKRQVHSTSWYPWKDSGNRSNRTVEVTSVPI